jgi:hypothetical protein
MEDEDEDEERRGRGGRGEHVAVVAELVEGEGDDGLQTEATRVMSLSGVPWRDGGRRSEGSTMGEAEEEEVGVVEGAVGDKSERQEGSSTGWDWSRGMVVCLQVVLLSLELRNPGPVSGG